MNPTSAESEVLAEDAPLDGWVLTALDRCDACNAQAYVRTRLASGNLFWCAHHYNGNEARLKEVTVDILDERARLA